MNIHIIHHIVILMDIIIQIINIPIERAIEAVLIVMII